MTSAVGIKVEKDSQGKRKRVKERKAVRGETDADLSMKDPSESPKLGAGRGLASRGVGEGGSGPRNFNLKEQRAFH